MFAPFDMQQSLDVVRVGLHVLEGRGEASLPVAEEEQGSHVRSYTAMCGSECTCEHRHAHMWGYARACLIHVCEEIGTCVYAHGYTCGGRSVHLFIHV